jgi:predicted nucleotidyltransferase
METGKKFTLSIGSEIRKIIMATMTARKIVEEIRRVCESMSDDLQGHRVVLFGSRASGDARERSDFDVGVLGDHPLPLKVFFRMEDLFDEIDTLYKIDWVDLNRVSPEFHREALKKMEALYG